MRKKQVWGFVVSSLFVMMLANVPIVFSDESLSPSSESISEVLESSTTNESVVYRVGESTTESSVVEENKTTETTETISSETIDTSTSESQLESSTEEIILFRAATVTSEKVVGKYTTIISKDLILWKVNTALGIVHQCGTFVH